MTSSAGRLAICELCSYSSKKELSWGWPMALKNPALQHGVPRDRCRCCHCDTLSGASRRQFLSALAVSAAGALLESRRSFAQPAGPSSKPEPYRIDIHHHIVPPQYIAEEHVHKWLMSQTVNRQTIIEWTPEKAIEEMDRDGIATAVSSISVPGVWFDDVDLGRRLAREWNEYAASLMHKFPGRFGLFATIPLPDTEGSLQEVAYALDVLKADGIALFTSYGSKYPGDTSFLPVFEELNRRKTVVYFHPTTPVCCRGLTPGVPPPLIEYPTDTTRAIMHIILSGLAVRVPDIRFVFAHAGGTMTAAVGRFNSLIPHTEKLAQRLPHGLNYQLAKFYYDTANSAVPITMDALMTLVPISHILLGTDSPFVPVSVTVDALEKLPLSKEDLRAIERDNALALIPQLRV